MRRLWTSGGPILRGLWGGFGCDIVGLLQESKRPLPRKLRKKSEKGSRALSALWSKKPKKESKMTIFKFFSSFRLVFNFFSTSFELFQPQGREGPGTPFQTFFGVF